eukprot:CAMPEP_0198331216 /NCGR_PEP_ID=MMETSP1450-20131203/17437_1 /TAXON_ID=753684 ORGANISM="Madagascaria erythrocladiodes, Strain CCMP3234" /NCGR_SAMPLE_ID=MMETSP1450 /ASSEMBLY_ACC=CAM_ASM_001115 /LENGTH=35 /DNA_ID= /DNA_START= /DNA_END= /DNA_ORIENTATION=
MSSPSRRSTTNNALASGSNFPCLALATTITTTTTT